MPNRKFIISSCIVLTSLIAKSALAVCPVCTVAVGAGLGLAEWFGIDDTISGLWIGGLTVSLIIWTINWLNGKSSTLRNSESSAFGREKLNFGNIRNIFIFLIYYTIIVLPLWWKGMIGHPYNKLCGVDKLLFGIILGSVLFFLGVLIHNYLRKKNGGKSYFKGQKIVAAIFPLIIASVIFYFTC